MCRNIIIVYKNATSSKLNLNLDSIILGIRENISISKGGNFESEKN